MSITYIYQKGYTNHVDVDVHPNGKSAYLIINKTETVDGKSQRNLRIVEVDVASKLVTREIKRYVEGTNMFGPAGYCSIKCLPNGGLFAGLAIARDNDPTQIVAGFDIIENVIPVFDPTSDNTTIPTPVEIVDQVARNMAADALNKLVDMSNAIKVYATITQLNEAVNGVNARTDTIVSALPTKDYVWSNIADRISVEIASIGTGVPTVFEHDVFKRYIRKLGTEALLVAIEYARTNPDQSSLRKLIREIILAGS